MPANRRINGFARRPCLPLRPPLEVSSNCRSSIGLRRRSGRVSPHSADRNGGVRRASLQQKGIRLILFLDYDGVLHPDPCRDRERLFENAPRLLEVLQDFPEVDVVLSTSWRAVYRIEELVMPLPQPLAARVVGITPLFSGIEAPRPLAPYARHAECMQWLQQQSAAERDWIALDDRPSWFAPYCEQLIVCDPLLGFDAQAASRLRWVLARSRQKLTASVDARI